MRIEILAANQSFCSSKLMTMPEPHSASSAAIELRSVSRQYQMGETLVRAVDQVSFAIPRGDFAALLGPSGSGKSTLLNLIAGLDRPTSGAIVVDGRDLATMSSEELAKYRRNTVGMIFQSFNLVPTMTLAENVELPMRFAEVDRPERAQRATELLTKVGLASRADHRPSQLSGGEQQRGAIARALVNRPTLLLADEPTGNLDSRTGHEIMDLIVELNSALGVTIVMVTHEQALADRYSRRALHMADGKLANVIEEVKL
jgi:putative ABC transport system ATP-binding protein